MFVSFVAGPFKFDTSDRFACMIHHLKAKTLLFPMMCCNLNLVKPFGKYVLLNTRSTAKNLHSRRDHNLSVLNQYYRQFCMSYSIENHNVKYHELSVLSNSWTQSYSFLIYLNKNIEYWGKH